MTDVDKPQLSVVTATMNAASSLPSLIASLRAQTDKDFEWVVADGASSDSTAELLASVRDLNLVVSSQSDFGIYEALNRAIRLASGTYYVVAGSDDSFAPDAIAQFKKAIRLHRSDVIVANATYGAFIFKRKKLPRWIVGDKAYIAHHSLASAFKKSLHLTFGYYSKKFPIAADSHFVLRAIRGGASLVEADFIAGSIGRKGVSYVDWAGGATELFRVQLENDCSVLPQLALLAFRVLKGRYKPARKLHQLLFRRRLL